MSIGPWFKCAPDAFVKGMSALTIEEQAFYTQLVMRMYDAGDAIYCEDKTIAKWCNSNVRRWERVKASLIEKKRIFEMQDGGLIDERCLDEMVDACTRRKAKVSEKIRKRIAKLARCFANDTQIISKTSLENHLKTNPLKEEEIRKDRAEFPPEALAVLGALQASCVSAGLGQDFGLLNEAIQDWDDGTFYVNSAFSRDRYGERLSRQLRAENVRLAVQSTPVESPQPKLTAITGGKA